MDTRIRQRILLKGKNKCAYCGSTECLEVDHIIPISRGGREDENNMQILCKKCNIKKGKHIDISKYFREDKEYLYIRTDFPTSAFTSDEILSILSQKFESECGNG